MLTGIEQYHWERAGYFIRRSYLDEDVLLAMKGTQYPAVESLREIARPLIDDLLGEPNTGDGKRVRASECWNRSESGAGYSESYATLAAQPEGVVIRLALAQDEAMHVLPGSHTTPLTGDELGQLQGDPAASLPGAIRVRLAPGDALFYHTALLAIVKTSTDENSMEILFRKHRG